MVVKKSILCVLVLAMMLTVGCNSYKVTTGSGTMDFKNAAVVEENDEYKLMLKEDLYCVFFNDGDKEAVANFGPVAQQPVIEEISDSVLKLSILSGNTVSWYYNAETQELSQLYDSVACETEELVAVVDGSVIAVYNIYNGELFQEISEFSEPMDSVSEPIVSAEFSDDGSELIVTYLNDASVETTENIKINSAE